MTGFHTVLCCVIDRLEIKGIGDRGEDGEDGELDEGTVVAVPCVFVTFVYHVGVFVVVEVVNADVDRSGAAFECAVKVGADVHTVIVGHTEIVASRRV